MARIREIECAALAEKRELTPAELATIEQIWRRVDEIESRIMPAPAWKDPAPAADDSEWTAPL